MKNVGLFELIKHLEYGTNLHIGVFFLGGKYNNEFYLPHKQTIHTKKVCENFKKHPKDYDRCFRCRNYSLQKAIRERKSFGALCINGVYEYTKPVIFNDTVVAVVFIGNILTEKGELKLKKQAFPENVPFETMEKNYDYELCNELGEIITWYIITSIEKNDSINTNEKNIIRNVKSYLLENIEYDIKLSNVAKLFHYNEVYLGRLFKEQTGVSINKYLCIKRINLAKDLLKKQTSITEIAIRTGFNSISYFNRIFKKHVGITPSKYRKEIANTNSEITPKTFDNLL